MQPEHRPVDRQSRVHRDENGYLEKDRKAFFLDPQRMMPIAWRVLRPVVIGCISLFILMAMIFVASDYVYSHYIGAADPTSDEPVLIEVERGSSKSTIASLLESNGLIKSSTFFKF